MVTASLQRAIYCSQVMSLLRSLIDYNLGLEDLASLDATAIWTGMSADNPGLMPN